jgi:hypothetical protein
MPDTHDEHLGDGVYVSFDGYQIWLAANHHENKVVALEPDVIMRLIRYAERLGILAPRRPAEEP